MSCHYDFFSVEVSSKTIKPLLSAGIKRDKITQHRTGYRTYGYGYRAKTYPVYAYYATVGYTEQNGDPDSIARVWRDKGLNAHIKYHCVD